MPLSAISSLSLWARDQALQTLLKTRYEQGKTPEVFSLDLLDSEEAGCLNFRVMRQSPTQTAKSSITVEGDCPSCATLHMVREFLDVLEPTPETSDEVLVVLPTAVSLSTALSAAEATDHEITNAVLALDPTTVEDDLWSTESLSAHVLNTGCEDERTAGEFLIGEIGWADTAIISEIPLTHATQGESDRAKELLDHLGPHLSLLAEPSAQAVCGCFDRQKAIRRNQPGEIPSLEHHQPGALSTIRAGESFTTVVVHTGLPLDREKFAEALPAMVEGACRVRGTVAFEDFAGEHIAVEGIGPAVWLESLGQTNQTTTRIAITGDDLDPEELQGLLDSCTTTVGAEAQH